MNRVSRGQKCGRGRYLWVSRHVVAIVALLFVGSRISLAQAQSAEFSAGVEAYQRGMFDSARVHFESLVKSGIDDSRVWYNLGNTCYKLGEIGESIAAYRRAMKLDPRDDDLVANYRYVRLFAADKIEAASRLFLALWWEALWSRFTFGEAKLLAVLFFWLALLVWGVRIWRVRMFKHRRAWITTAIVGLVFFWLVSFGGTLTTYHRDFVQRDAVITALSSEVRGGPGREFALQFTAHDGLECIVEREEANWALVAFPNGLKGWVDRSTLTEI